MTSFAPLMKFAVTSAAVAGGLYWLMRSSKDDPMKALKDHAEALLLEEEVLDPDLIPEAVAHWAAFVEPLLTRTVSVKVFRARVAAVPVTEDDAWRKANGAAGVFSDTVEAVAEVLFPRRDAEAARDAVLDAYAHSVAEFIRG
jgi:hypothetical protein